MSKSLIWRIILIVVIILFSLFKVYPTVKWAMLPKEQKQSLMEKWEQEQQQVIEEKSLWKSFKLNFKRWYYGDEDRTLKLGLDLKGGIYFVVETKAEKIDKVLEILRRRINRTKVAEPMLQQQGKDKIIIQLPGYENIEKAEQFITARAFMRWLLVAEDLMIARYDDEKGKNLLIAMYQNTVKELELEHRDSEEGWTYEELDERLAELLPPDAILRIYESKNTDRRTGKVTKETIPLLMRKENVATGDHLRKAMDSTHPSTSEPILSFELKGIGKDRFYKTTKTYSARGPSAIPTEGGRKRGWRIAILLDDVVLSAPNIQTAISGSGMIEGGFTVEEARRLGIQLNAGSLPTGIKVVERELIGPTLGRISIQKGVNAAMLGLAVVMLFMIIYYLKAGIISVLALLLNLLILVGLLASLNATLTLPGIAGIILTIGMAVDANVLIFERMREETRAAKKIRAAIDSGYHKAFRTIMDANLTTLITAIVLYYFGRGPVQGFAVTLSLGICTSMFTSVVVTRVVFDLMLLNRKFTSINLLQLFAEPKIDFVKNRQTALTISIIVIVLGIFSFAIAPGENFGVDFTGGNQTVVKFDKNVDSEAIRRFINEDLDIDAEVKYFGGKNEIMIQTRKGTVTEISERISNIFKEELEEGASVEIKNDRLYLTFRENSDIESVEKKLVAADLPIENVRYGESKKEILADYTGGITARLLPKIQEKFPEYKIQPQGVSTSEVGPSVGKTLRHQALIAVILSMIGMIIYISWRFEFKFAIAAIVAIFHDILITLGFFSGMFFLMRRQIDLPIVAALLTIIGYSLNDTIVVFDRIREDLKIMKRLDFKAIINTSINQTLSRTALTSATTLLVVISLLIFGGARINNFAFALLIGVIAGTYSSIFIASPLLVLLHKKK